MTSIPQNQSEDSKTYGTWFTVGITVKIALKTRTNSGANSVESGTAPFSSLHCLPVYMSVCMCVCMSVCVYVCLSVCLSVVCLSVCRGATATATAAAAAARTG